MSRPVLVLIHAPWETPALIGEALASVPCVQRSVLDEHAPELPPVSSLAGLVVMGGPQDANDDARFAGLAAERRLLAEAVGADVPVLGICLGMQLLALALGATLHLRHGRELGFAPVELTERGAADPALSAFGREQSLAPLHWHSDAVELPRGAELLASTPATPVQAFRLGSALGVQFHPEADAALLERWLATPAMVGELEPGQVERLRAEAQAHLPGLRAPALASFAAFEAAVRQRRGA
jgi:GMP synthase (glutamine-hydrolysing)